MTSRGKAPVLETLIACCVVSICGCNGADSVIGSAASNGGRETRFAISDAATGGRRGFYFLPPLVKSPAYSGIFDGSLSPTVEICEYGANRCVATIATYSMTAGPGSDRVRVDAEKQHYSVNWNTAAFSLDVRKIYRVRAFLWSIELGSIDVDPVASAQELKTVDASRFVGLLNGTTLAIKFRVETSALWEGLAPLVLSRKTAPAGALVEMNGIDPTTIPLGELSLFIGGRPTTVNRTGTGGLLGGVPFFLDPTGWPAPPPDAQSVVLLRNGIPIAGAKAALTITALSDAPGSSQQALTALRSIMSFFDNVVKPLTPGPSVEDAFLQSHRAALQALLDGPGANSLASVLNQAAGSPAARLLDAWFASSGVLAALQQYVALAQGTTFPASASRATAPVTALGGRAQLAGRSLPTVGGSPSLTALAFAGPVSDLELARQMQLYEVVRMFSQTVVAGTNTTFSNYVANAAGLLGLAASAVMISPSFAPVALTSFALAITDFIANKVIVGLMPAGIQTFDLSVANSQLQTGELTDATLRVVAVNDPPTVSLNELVGLFLTSLGTLPAPEAETLSQLMEGFASFYLNLLQSMLSQYASANPQLNLDVSLYQLPALQWQATITDPRLVERKSQTPTIIDGDLVEMNWRASQTNTGQGRIYAVPSMAASAILISPPAGIVYAAGAFGDDVLSSNVVTVQVGDVNVTVNPGSVNLSPSGTQQFTATVTGNSNTAVTWTTDDPSGSVTSTGFYTAGAATGIYSVVATSVADPSQKGAAAVTISPPSGVRVSGTNISDVRANCGRTFLDRIDWGWTPLTNQTFATSKVCNTTLANSALTESADALSQYTVIPGSGGAKVITGAGNATVTGIVDEFIDDTNVVRGTLTARAENFLEFTLTTPMTYQLTGNLIATPPTDLDGFQYKFGSATLALVPAGGPAAIVSVVGPGPVSSTGMLQPGTYVLSVGLHAEVKMNIVLNATATAGTTFTLRLTP